MKNIIIYLDNCTFNRPFDDQKSVSVRFEAEAKLHIQDMITNGRFELVWSYILEFENSVNPFSFRKNAILQWKEKAKYFIYETKDIIDNALKFEKMGLKSKDALHIACAINANAKYFITTDKKILKKLKNYNEIIVINPVEFLMSIEG